jgi:DNA processing protein
VSDIAQKRRAIIMAITDSVGIGSKTFQQLLINFGPPESFLNATYNDFESIPRLKDKGARLMMEALESLQEYEDKLSEYSHQGISMLSFFDDEYPESLRQIGSPPPAIYIKGDVNALKSAFIAIVGTTQASETGLKLAVDLSREFVKRGFGIVSGLARGIDSAAHLGALKENGVTIAVLGSGIMRVFPDENILLAENILRNGLLISEQNPYRRVRTAGLILRNRIIAGLAKAVVVAQVGIQRRGELRTVQYSNKQATPVFFADPENDLDRKNLDRFGVVIGNDVNSVDEIISQIV